MGKNDEIKYGKISNSTWYVSIREKHVKHWKCKEFNNEKDMINYVKKLHNEGYIIIK
jgi:hypothetical protein